MKREIKFRVWDLNNKMWLDYIKINQSGIWMTAGDHKMISMQRPEEIVLMQCTGLKDKNGKEIYEGDVLEHWNDKYVIPNFIPLSRYYEADNVLKHHDGSDDWMSMSDCDWEVIGNIYENPELLTP